MRNLLRIFLVAVLATFSASAHPQALVRFLQHSGFAGVDVHKVGFDRGAFKDYKSLARLGDNTGQFNLAVMYHARGQHQRAAHWYRRAALFRHPLAAYNLGLMYYRGEGVEQDFGRAYRWMHKSAKAGFITAQLQLGIMIYRGEGTEHDPEQEAYWYRQAAMQGDPEAQYNLSVLYSMGEGLPHDPVNAYAWMKLANARGLPADTELMLLRSLLSDDQRASAEARFGQLDLEVEDRRSQPIDG